MYISKVALEVFQFGNFVQKIIFFVKVWGAASIGDGAAIRNFTLYLGRTSGLAVSSSLMQWIDEFASPEKFNMAMIESDLDPKLRKMSIIF